METSDENLIQDEDIPIRSKRSANSRNQQWRDNRDNSFLGANRRMYSSSSTKVHSHPDDEEVNGNEGRKGFHRNIMGAEDMKNAEIKSKNGYLSDGTEYNERNTRQTQDYRSGRPSSFKSLESGTAMGNCRRYPMYVNFEDLGWGGWIIHPQGYNAYHCQGLCPFPLGAHLNPTNHATVQSIMHTLGLGAQPIEMPCCAPSKLYDINLLYFDSNDYVVLRRYKDMVAASCSCR